VTDDIRTLIGRAFDKLSGAAHFALFGRDDYDLEDPGVVQGLEIRVSPDGQFLYGVQVQMPKEKP
jgi:hypothetical protein